MTANLTSTPLRLQFDNDTATRAYFVCEELRSGIESVDTGIAPKRLQLQISASALTDSATPGVKQLYPLAFYDPRVRRDLWRPGRVINAEFFVNGAWLPHPMFPAQILIEPAPPTAANPSLVLELGCKLAYLMGGDVPDGDESGIATGTATNLSDVAERLLIAGGLTAPEISLTADWGYSIAYPSAKDGGTYIDQAAALAEAANRVIYQGKDGIIRDRPIFDFNQSAALTITIGQDEAREEPSQEASPPPTKARAVANGTNVTSPTGGVSNTAVIDGPVSGIVPGGSGTAIIVQTTFSESYNETNPDAYTISRTNRIDRIAAAISSKISPAGQLVLAEEAFETEIYDAQKRLTSFQRDVIYPRVAVVPEVESNLLGRVIYGRRIQTVYNYSTDDEIERITTEEWAIKRLIYPETTDPFTERTSRLHVERWDKDNGKDIYTASELFPLAQINPDAIEEEEDAYRLTADPGATPPDPRTPRPAVQTYQRPGNESQFQIEGEKNFAHPGGNIGRDRERTWQIDPGISQAQLEDIALVKGALAWGRAQSRILELPVSPALAAIDYPNWRIDITYPARIDRITAATLDPARTETYLVDSMVWTHTGDEARALLMLAWAGTVSGGSITPPYIVS